MSYIDSYSDELGEDYDLSSFDSLISTDKSVDINSSFLDNKLYWTVPIRQLGQVLKTIRSFSSKSNMYIAFMWDSGNVRIHANNRDYAVDAYLKVSSKNPYTGDKVFFLDFNTFSKFVKTYPDFAFVFGDDGTLTLETGVVKYAIETFPFNFDVIGIKTLSLTSSFENKIPVPFEREEVTKIKKLFSFNDSVCVEKFILSDRSSCVYFKLYGYERESDFSMFKTPLFLRKPDITVIQSFIDIAEWMYYDDMRTYFYCDFMTVSFTRAKSHSNKDWSSLGGEVLSSFSVDLPSLFKVLKIILVSGGSTVSFQGKGSSVLAESERISSIIGNGNIAETFFLDSDLLTKILSALPSDVVRADFDVYDNYVNIVVSGCSYRIARMTQGKSKIQDSSESRANLRRELVEGLENKGVTVVKMTDNDFLNSV